MAVTDRKPQRRSGRRSLRAGLAAACTLVGIHAAPAQPISVDSAVLVYKEPDRIGVLEALFEGRKDFGYGRTGTLKLVFDTLSGASANGAAPAGRPQTFTGPSGSSGYTTPAGETPLDKTFKDTRVALGGTYNLPLDRLTSAGFGLNASVERDYTSLGASASLSRDFFKRNTTLSASLSASHDLVRPIGGRPIQFDVMPPPSSEGEEADKQDDEEGNRPGTLGDADKNVLDLVLGATQVVDRRTLVQVNYSYGYVNGYQTDPYKLLSVVDAVTGDPTMYLYESRPAVRNRHAVAGMLKHHFGWSVVNLSYRYYRDNWGVRSHTGEFRLRWSAGKDGFLEPQLRYYKQTAAEFYRRYLLDGAALPAFASADYRLGEFDAITVGLRYGHTLTNGHLLTLRGEYYRQTGNGYPADAPPGLRIYDLFPTIDAFVFQVGYSLSIL